MTWVPKNRATDGEDDDSKNGEDEKGKYKIESEKNLKILHHSN